MIDTIVNHADTVLQQKCMQWWYGYEQNEEEELAHLLWLHTRAWPHGPETRLMVCPFIMHSKRTTGVDKLKRMR